MIINATVDYSTFPLKFTTTKSSNITIISGNSNLTIKGKMGGTTELYGTISGTFNNGGSKVLTGGNINIPSSQQLTIAGIMNNPYATFSVDGTLIVLGTLTNGIESNSQSGKSFENLAGNIIASGTIQINSDGTMNNYGGIYLPGGNYTNNGTTTQSGIFYISNSQNSQNSATNNIFVNDGTFNIHGLVVLNNYNTSVQGGGIAYIKSVENNDSPPSLTTNVNKKVINVYSPGTFYIISATMENSSSNSSSGGKMSFIPGDISTAASLTIGVSGIMINLGTLAFTSSPVDNVTEYSVLAAVSSGSRFYNGSFVSFADQSKQVQYGAGGNVPSDIFYGLSVSTAKPVHKVYSIPPIPTINQSLTTINNHDIYLLPYNNITTCSKSGLIVKNDFLSYSNHVLSLESVQKYKSIQWYQNNILIRGNNATKISIKNSGVYSAVFTLQGSDSSEYYIANYNVNLTSQTSPKTYYITVNSTADVLEGPIIPANNGETLVFTVENIKMQPDFNIYLNDVLIARSNKLSLSSFVGKYKCTNVCLKVCTSFSSTKLAIPITLVFS